MPLQLAAADLGYRLPDGALLFSSLHLTLFDPVRTGLVGRNGSGKSTLFDLLAGRRPPSQGAVSCSGRLAYLPQSIPLDPSATVAGLLGRAAEWAAHARIAAGAGSMPDFERVEGCWDLPERIEALFARLGLAHVSPARPASTLSGGELMRVRLAALLLEEPDFLLLDEPTNHLDRDARRFVYDLVGSWRRGLLVVSHDRALLGLVDQIVELGPSGLRVYGGGFGFYRHQRAVERAAAEHAAHAAGQALDRAEEASRLARERQERRTASGRRRGVRTGVGKMAAGNLKRAAERSAGLLKERHAQRVEEAAERALAARESLPPERQIHVDLAPGGVPAGKRILEAAALNYRFPGAAAPLWPEPLRFSLYGPARVALAGPNGSGKSTLVALIRGLRSPTEGSLYVGTGRIGVLDQRVALLDDGETLLDNLRRHAPARPVHELRILLGRFLFPGEAVFKRAGVLSGGERLRAGLACLLGADQAPELLILDEPTNNLDLASLEEVASALRGYRGALLVISHDEAFLEEAEVGGRIELG